MAIISRLPQGAGGGNITKMLTINGGVGETISVVGEGLEDSVVLDSTGTSTYILIAKKDTLVTFTGGLSGYTKRIAMVDKEDAVVNVMPEGALYWYGNMSNDWTLVTTTKNNSQANTSAFYYDVCGANYESTKTKDINCVSLYGYGNKDYKAISSIVKQISVTDISKIFVSYDVDVTDNQINNYTDFYLEVCSNNPSSSNSVAAPPVQRNSVRILENVVNNTIELDVSVLSGNYYLHPFTVVSNSGSNTMYWRKSTTKIHKIWLE